MTISNSGSLTGPIDKLIPDVALSSSLISCSEIFVTSLLAFLVTIPVSSLPGKLSALLGLMLLISCSEIFVTSLLAFLVTIPVSSLLGKLSALLGLMLLIPESNPESILCSHDDDEGYFPWPPEMLFSRSMFLFYTL